MRATLAAGAETPGALVTCPSGYLLRVGAGELDAERFERLVEEGGRALAAGLAQRAAEQLREALALWRGPALADVANESSLQLDITGLEELRIAALEERIEADLALGRHGALIAELERLVAEQPLRERPRGHGWPSTDAAGRRRPSPFTAARGRRSSQSSGSSPARRWRISSAPSSGTTRRSWRPPRASRDLRSSRVSAPRFRWHSPPRARRHSCPAPASSRTCSPAVCSTCVPA